LAFYTDCIIIVRICGIIVLIEKHILDIPIYRCNRENFYAADKAAKEKFLSDIPGSGEEFPNSYRRIDNQYEALFCFPWVFNDIIGWIRLKGTRLSINADLFFVTSRRIRRRPKSKTFKFRGELFKLNVQFAESNYDIFNQVLEELKELYEIKYLKKRFIDLEVFYNIGPHLDWIALMKRKD